MTNPFATPVSDRDWRDAKFNTGCRPEGLEDNSTPNSCDLQHCPGAQGECYRRKHVAVTDGCLRQQSGPLVTSRLHVWVYVKESSMHHRTCHQGESGNPAQWYLRQISFAE